VIDAYHHGDLRRAVLDRAVQVIASEGTDALSLRALAADLGVSHTAPRHHFASRQGLLTAVAVEGSSRSTTAWPRSGTRADRSWTSASATSSSRSTDRPTSP
jgi:AcrR family transcriptional regulator